MATSPQSVMMPRTNLSDYDEFARARFRDCVYDAIGDLADIRARLDVEYLFVTKRCADQHVVVASSGSGGPPEGAVLAETDVDLCTLASGGAHVADRGRVKTRGRATVTVRLDEAGRSYGVVGCRLAGDRLARDRVAPALRALAHVLSIRLAATEDEIACECAIHARILHTIANDELRVVYQPIINLNDQSLWGYEALARFPAGQDPSPTAWFRNAVRVGLSTELELAAVRTAIASFSDVPGAVGTSTNPAEDVEQHSAAPPQCVEPDGPCLTLNVSATLLSDPRLIPTLRPLPAGKVVLELTEHTDIDDYPAIQRALRRLRSLGVRLSADDTGSGYAGLRHLVSLGPEFIKLDVTLTRAVNTDPLSEAMVRALCCFAEQTGASVIAEGVETEADLVAVRRLGIGLAQGYLLGRPLAHAPTLGAQSTVRRPHANGKRAQL